jgi:hypothetical protein
VLETPALQHGVCVADGEVFVTGYDNAVHRIRRQRGEWIAEKIADLPGAGKNIILVSGMLVVSSTDGSLVGIERDGTTWSARVLDKRDRGRSRLGTDGRRVLVSDDDGLLSIVTPSEDGRSWSREEIHREFDRERGAVLADLDPDTPGLEVATAGYEFRITLLREADGAWWSKLLFRDSERFHHLAAGDVDGEPGIELVGCGYSGRVTVLRRVGR